METTLEVRWFIPGRLPNTIQHWFRFQCPGELLETEAEVREDLYIPAKPQDFSKFCPMSPQIGDREAINLKLRQGNVELKLRRQKLGTRQFDNLYNSGVWTGNVEQWYKLSESELKDFDCFFTDSITETNWISVYKRRLQKIEGEVKSELTQLKVGDRFWWSMAFEMTQNSSTSQQNKCFPEVIQRSCQTYRGVQLSAQSSYGYSRWLLLLDGRLINS